MLTINLPICFGFVEMPSSG